MNSDNLFGENKESQTNDNSSLKPLQNNSLNNNSSVGLETPNQNIIETQNTSVMGSVNNTIQDTPFTRDIPESSYETPFTRDNVTTQQVQETPFTKDNTITQKMTQSSMSFNYMIDNQSNEEILKSFIGKNYDKITTRTFNIPGFFLGTFYIFYRKMYLFGLIFFAMNLIILGFIKSVLISSIASLLLEIMIGFTINKIYMIHVKKKIIKLKMEESHKTLEELKNICAKKGGTSFGSMILGVLAELGILGVIIAIMLLFGINNYITNIFKNEGKKEENNNNNNNTTIKENLVKNVVVKSYSCIDTKCSITVKNFSGEEINYIVNNDDAQLLKELNNYSEYIQLDIYYTSNKTEKSISKYKIFLKSTNEELSGIKTENELREKLGLYTLGTHTDSFTLTKIGTQGVGFNNDENYTYITYTFTDSKKVEYKMKYINPDKKLKLTEGKKYNVTFEVIEGTFDYEYNIKSIK